jgi:hypothetical protein
MDRRFFLTATSAFAAAGALRAGTTPIMHVAKSPTCGCCAAWVEHVRAAGFAAEVSEVDQERLYSLKARLGISPELASCHTAMIGDYIIEGHVPAEDIARLLTQEPADALGLAVPGMPIGSPGMEMGDTREPYDVLMILKTGGTLVFSSHG